MLIFWVVSRESKRTWNIHGFLIWSGWRNEWILGGPQSPRVAAELQSKGVCTSLRQFVPGVCLKSCNWWQGSARFPRSDVPWVSRRWPRLGLEGFCHRQKQLIIPILAQLPAPWDWRVAFTLTSWNHFFDIFCSYCPFIVTCSIHESTLFTTVSHYYPINHWCGMNFSKRLGLRRGCPCSLASLG